MTNPEFRPLSVGIDSDVSAPPSLPLPCAICLYHHESRASSGSELGHPPHYSPESAALRVSTMSPPDGPLRDSDLVRRPLHPDVGPVTTNSSVVLTIIVPVHNEQDTVLRTLSSLLALSLPCPYEVIAVDDGSTDDTLGLLQHIMHSRLTVLRHKQNRGKGAAVLTALQTATGTHVLVFDADSEYNPKDIVLLLHPLLEQRSDIVYGTRRFGYYTAYASLRYALGNVFLTFFANLLFDSVITDLHTCLKLVPTPLLSSLGLTEKGFGLDTQITAELLRRGIRPFEVPISYVARSKNQGKKITWKDGLKCLEILVRVRLRSRNKPSEDIDLRTASHTPHSADTSPSPPALHVVDS